MWIRPRGVQPLGPSRDRKSTRLNSSHVAISYAVHRVLPSFPTRRSSDLWTADMTLPVVSTFPIGGNLGCNPLNLPTDVSVKLLVSATDNCGVTATNVSHVDQTTGCSATRTFTRSEEHTSELQSRGHLVCRPPRSPLFPYTTLFRSLDGGHDAAGGLDFSNRRQPGL